ncbi:MAG TPA: ATP-binding cassette domain-containing protein, partial [Verrucomicrobiae bacterium]|nr:ATP-binding cassette domain-containing protein [Verrucomicrobiae bacterium]
MKGAVTLSNLSKRFPGERGKPGHAAVCGIHLEVRPGELMVLVGPSGCGKSTILRLIAGLEAASEGEIRIGEREMARVEPKDRGVAMVFQNYALYPHMTVYENMAFTLKLAGKSKTEIREMVSRAAASLGLSALLQRKPRALSGGQRQRVALGRAMVRNPDVFLFDEPLSNLDARMRVQMRGEIAQLHRSLGATMIYVTHDQAEAMTLGDRICVMRDGLIMQVAEPLALYRRPANLFVAGFIGSPPMNLARGMIQARDGGFAFGADPEFGGWKLPLQGRAERLARARGAGPVVFGFRPEHVS